MKMKRLKALETAALFGLNIFDWRPLGQDADVDDDDVIKSMKVLKSGSIIETGVSELDFASGLGATKSGDGSVRVSSNSNGESSGSDRFTNTLARLSTWDVGPWSDVGSFEATTGGVFAPECGAWDSNLADHAVAPFGDELHMLYIPSASVGLEKGFGIGHAISIDGGLSWARNDDNPIYQPSDSDADAWENGAMFGLDLMAVGSTFYLFYSAGPEHQDYDIGLMAGDHPANLSRETSVNPVITRDETWEATEVRNPTVIRRGNDWHCYYMGRNRSAEDEWCIGHSTSSDGENWTNDSNPVITPADVGSWGSSHVANPTAWIEGETVYLLFEGLDDGLNPTTGAASSTNFLDFTFDPANPVISPGESGTYFENYQTWVELWREGSTYKVFQTGFDKGGTARFGFLEMDITPP